jgi:threonine aldolase
VIDLRSDTVTKPSAAMRAVMTVAEVGDDDYHDDPTVNRLEARAAELLGKEAGLFVPSGIMSNLIAALTHCSEERRVVALADSHIVWSLSGNARIGRLVQFAAVPNDARGLPLLDALEDVFDPPDVAPVGLLCLENTHNQAGGTALAPAETAPAIAVARARGIPIHLDGARLFNAAVALGLPASALAADVDSATFCVSKGLGAPIGSVLCGDAAFIARARDYRKWLGGTMRQVGIVAAAGLYALETGINRLAEDHAHAQWLATQLRTIPGLRVSPQRVETNILFVEHVEIETPTLYDLLLARGIQTNDIDGRIRLVTHRDVDRAQLEQAVATIAEVATTGVRAVMSHAGRPLPPS